MKAILTSTKTINFKLSQFTKLIILFSTICIVILSCRIYFSGQLHFVFLIWNLFLAFIPFLILKWMEITDSNSKLMKIVGFSSWLLFFPNAPYILTDLFHLSHNASAPIWFDLVLILSFAWTGLLLGFKSLFMMEEIIFNETFTPRGQQIISVILLFISAFGIYLGRYLRWNSWDIIQKPKTLLYDITDRFIDPFSHPRTWGMTIGMGIFLIMVYLSFKVFRKKKAQM